ncbi:MAG: molybdate ABC transporter permease subunit [Deltaproteobacteria bacterium]|nr:molybdate ABC transporter permease subunit [Deltaproteobacteria bacterium]
MDEQIWFSIKLSLLVSALSTVFVALIGGAIAYLLATREFRGKIILEVLITLPLIMPPTVTGYYLIMIFGRNGFLGKLLYEIVGWSIMFTWQAAVLASFIISLPLMVRTTQAAIASVDITMRDTATMLGYSEWQTALKVVIPLAKKGILAGVVLAFARAMGEFGATLMVAGNIPGRTSTMPLAIYSYAASGDWEKAHSLVLLLTLTSGLFIFLARQFELKGGK